MPGTASESCRHAADSLSIFQTGRVDIQREGQRGKETGASNVCGLDVAVPSGVGDLAAAGWYLRVTGQTSAERAQDGQHGRWSPGCVCKCVAHSLWPEYRGYRSEVCKHVSNRTPALLIYISKI